MLVLGVVFGAAPVVAVVVVLLVGAGVVLSSVKMLALASEFLAWDDAAEVEMLALASDFWKWVPTLHLSAKPFLSAKLSVPRYLIPAPQWQVTMLSFNTQPWALHSTASLLRAGFATSRPRYRALPPGPRGSVRRPPPPKPLSKRPPRSKLPKQVHGHSHETAPRSQENSPENQQPQQSSLDLVSSALRNQDSDANNLLAPVHIPEDPDGVLKERHPATSILSNSAIVVTRQLELMNVMLGFEQANKYVIMNPQGGHIGYMAERELGMGNMLARQAFSTHRSFTTHVFDRHGKEVLRVCPQELFRRMGQLTKC